jgi:glycosyltransferase involved in cell wall biosynthesis
MGHLRDIALLSTARVFGIPVVCHLHHGRVPAVAEKKGGELSLLKRVACLAAKIVVLDQLSLQSMRSLGVGDRTTVVPNPFWNESVLTPTSDANSGGEFRVVFVGHVIKEKGVFDLLEACLAAEIPELIVDIVGPCDQPVGKRLAMIGRGFSGGKQVSFRGDVEWEEALGYMKRGSVVVLPSHSEGCPNVVLEAMACGKAVIGSRVGAIPDLLGVDEDDQAGICICPKDVSELCGALEKVYQDSTLLASLGQSGRRRVSRLFSPQIAYREYKSLWGDVSGRSA